MAKKPVDVENLMHWAASELSRKRPNDSGKVYKLDVPRGERDLIGRWNSPMGYPSMSPMFAAACLSAGNARGDPPDGDALIVEMAIERLRLVGVAFSPEVETDVRFGLGFEIDAAKALRKPARNVANLVLVHGRLGDRPSLRDEAPAPHARKAPNGKPGVWRLEEWSEPTFDDHAEASHVHEVAVTATRKGHYPPGAYGALEWDPDPQAIVDERAEYWAWRAGLAWLAEALAGELHKRAVLPPRAAERPWMGEKDAPPIGDLFSAGADRVYGGDEAAGLAGERRVSKRRAVGGGNVYAAAGERCAPRARGEK